MTYYVRVRVGSKAFNVRRQLLTQASEYFRVMISGDWRESKDHEIQLMGPIPSETAAKAVFDFLETDQINVTEGAIEEVVIAADFLQIGSIFPHLQQFMTMENWSEFRKLAQSLHQPMLTDAVLRFLSDNYIVASETEEFQKLTGDDKEIVRRLPLGNYSTTLVVMDSSLNMHYFHYNDGTWEDLTNLPRSKIVSRTDFILGGRIASIGQYIFVLVAEDMTQTVDFLWGGRRCRDTILSLTKTLIYNTKTNEWCEAEPLNLQCVSENSSVSYCVTAVGAAIYVFGKEMHHAYSLVTNSWKTVAEPPKDIVPHFWLRSGSLETRVVACREKLHVLCADSDCPRMVSYDPCEDRWSEPDPITLPANPVSVTVLGNERFVYISTFACSAHPKGKKKCTQHLLRYSPDPKKLELLKKWQHNEPISKSLALCNDKLYRFCSDRTVCVSLENGFTETILPPICEHPHSSFPISVPCDFLY
ncbi:ectoderm-neural cortex protein 1-like [Ptychodera flava]|uniref:ectoderm-neural cortex protein 1-like n=1 Tax=Ptychodera flava TaxID=63121 RepID=UPI003969ECDE